MSRAILVVIGALAAVAAILVGSYYGGIIGNRVQANYQKRVVTSQVEQHVRTPAFAQAAYDHFYDLCASVQGLEGQLDAQLSEKATATGDDLERVDANIAGIQGERSQAIAEYNADARKGYTLGQFRASDLPYRLPAGPYKEGDATSCGA